MCGRTGPHSTGKGPDPGLQKYPLTADDLLDYLVCGSRDVDTAVRTHRHPMGPPFNTVDDLDDFAIFHDRHGFGVDVAHIQGFVIEEPDVGETEIGKPAFSTASCKNWLETSNVPDYDRCRAT